MNKILPLHMNKILHYFLTILFDIPTLPTLALDLSMTLWVTLWVTLLTHTAVATIATVVCSMYCSTIM